MAFWPISALIHKIILEEEGQISSIDLRGFAAGKKTEGLKHLRTAVSDQDQGLGDRTGLWQL